MSLIFGNVVHGQGCSPDITPPNITGCPSIDDTVSTDLGSCSFVADGRWNVSANDNCLASTLSYTLSGATIAPSTTGPLDGVIFNLGVTSVLWTAVDPSGNASNCAFKVIVEDNELPVFTCLGNQTENTDLGVCTYTKLGADWNVTATDNCSTITPTYTLSGVTAGSGSDLNGEVFNLGVTTVTWSATDASGNLQTCIYTVTIIDNQVPTISCGPQSVNTDLDVCTYTNSGTGWDATGTDNCTTIFSYTLLGATTGTGSSLDGVVFNSGITTVNWIVDDGSGNTAPCSHTVTVTDIQAPIINCIPDEIVNTDIGTCTYTKPGTDWNATAIDNCSVASIDYILSGVTTGTGSDLDGVVFNLGVTIVNWTATDGSGNTDACSYTVTVLDITDPTASNPAPVAVECIGDVPGSDITVVTDEADNCTIVPIVAFVSDVSDGATCPETITRTYSVTDDCGNTMDVTQIITVMDITAPVITCPADITQAVDAGICGAIVTFNATATDNCGGLLTFVYSQDTATLFPVGATIVTATATDEAGNISSSCTFTVTVIDDEAPIITCPTDVTQPVDPGVCDALVTIDFPIVTDNCNILSVLNDYTGTTSATGTYPVGVTTVTYEVIDVNGNSNTCNFSVTVNDTIVPIIVCPGNITASNDLSLCGAAVNYTAPVGIDLCSTVTTALTSGLPDGSFFPVGTSTITYTATDAEGNNASCSFDIDVTDDEAPVTPVLPDVNAECIPVIPTTTDNCSGIILGTTTTPLTQGLVVVTWDFTDAAGNSTSATQNILFNDITDPVVPSLPDVIAECDVTIIPPTATDNCSGIVTATTADPLSYSTQGNFIINWNFDDGNGNDVSAIQFVIIDDVTPPTITAPVTVSVFPNNSGCTATGVDIGTPVTNDNCQVVSVTNDAPTVYLLGNTTVTWTVTDIGGNIDTTTQIVTVLPLTSIIDPVACDTYTAPDGQNYTSSGQYVAVIPGSNDCDSTITINLTVNQTTTSNVNISSCNSFLSPDGQVYTTDGVYIAVIPNVAGCDSTITINLTIDTIGTNNIALNGTIFSAIQEDVLYQWVNCTNNYSIESGEISQSFEPIMSGDYAVILTYNSCIDTSVCLTIDLNLIIPDVISPNNDGKNDLFVIEGIYDYPDNILEIYNRWGNLVHRSEGYKNDWGGINTEGSTYGGDKLPDGTYYYILDLGKDKSVKNLKGFVYITK